MSDSKTDRSAKPEFEDRLRLRHLLGALLMLVATWGLALIDANIGAYAVPALGVIGAALLFPGRFARFAPRTWNILGTLVVAVTLSDILFAAAAGRENVVPAVLRAALCIAVLRTLQPRNRREEQQHILLAMFLLAAGGALSLSPLFAVQTLLFIPLAGGVLFLTNLTEPRTVERDRRAVWGDFAYGPFLRRVFTQVTGRSVGFLAATLTGVLVLGTLIFLLMPRHRMNNEIPLLALKGEGKSGFSETVELGNVAEILRDMTPALRADPPDGRRPLVNPYWRLVALDRYRGDDAGAGFSMSEGLERQFRRVETGARWSNPSPRYESAEAVSWRVHMEGNVSRYPALPGPVKSVRFEKAERLRFNRPAELLRLEESNAATLHMQGEIVGDGARLPVDEREAGRLARLVGFRPAGQTAAAYPETLVAGPTDPASRETLARVVAEIRADAGVDTANAAEFANAASLWLARRHKYALTDGYGRKTARAGEPRDYMVRWLASDATGWCEHFATSFVLLVRAAGHPARLITGFSGGEWNEADRYLLVRMKNGHAWAEIYDGSGAWLRVDPTPGGALDDEVSEADSRLSPRTFSGFDAWYDGLTMTWFRRVVNFDAGDRKELARSLLEELKAGVAALREGWQSLTDREKTKARLRAHGPALATLAAALVAGLVVRRVWRGRVLARRIREASPDDPVIRRWRERAGRCLLTAEADRGRGRALDAELRQALETLRYDHPSRWPDPEHTLRRFRAARRRGESGRR